MFTHEYGDLSMPDYATVQHARPGLGRHLRSCNETVLYNVLDMLYMSNMMNLSSS